jgi:hypothetical protein
MSCAVLQNAKAQLKITINMHASNVIANRVVVIYLTFDEVD